MKALISPVEPYVDSSGNTIGFRVVEVANDIFEVADPLFWVECQSRSVSTMMYAYGMFAPIPAEPMVEIVVKEVTRFQALAALLQAGLLDEIEAYMTSPTTDPFIKLAWKEVLVFKRTSPLVASLGTLFGLSESQVDDLFIFASTIDA